jgi:hypothetical protein
MARRAKCNRRRTRKLPGWQAACAAIFHRRPGTMMNTSFNNESTEDRDDVAHREAQFRLGWYEASVKDRPAGTVQQMTWRNLGYRLGKLYGEASDEAIGMQYDWCVRGGMTNLVDVA